MAGLRERNGGGGRHDGSSTTPYVDETQRMAGVRMRHGGGGRHDSSTTTLYLDEEICPICFEALSKARMQARPIGSPYALSTLGGVVICDCGHGFCESCLTQYVRIAICEGRTRLGTLRCPMDHCTVPTQESLLEALAPLLIGRSICSIIERARLRRCLHCVSARSPIVTGLRYSPI